MVAAGVGIVQEDETAGESARTAPYGRGWGRDCSRRPSRRRSSPDRSLWSRLGSGLFKKTKPPENQLGPLPMVAAGVGIVQEDQAAGGVVRTAPYGRGWGRDCSRRRNRRRISSDRSLWSRLGSGLFKKTKPPENQLGPLPMVAAGVGIVQEDQAAGESARTAPYGRGWGRDCSRR